MTSPIQNSITNKSVNDDWTKIPLVELTQRDIPPEQLKLIIEDIDNFLKEIESTQEKLTEDKKKKLSNVLLDDKLKILGLTIDNKLSENRNYRLKKYTRIFTTAVTFFSIAVGIYTFVPDFLTRYSLDIPQFLHFVQILMYLLTAYGVGKKFLIKER